MNKLSCIIMNKFPDIETFEDPEEYYDGYWQLVLDYPLIMIPENRIIFWGFDVQILKNEYDLLKSIINLNTNIPNEQGYNEEELTESINYRRRNFKVSKISASQRFITTSMSRIKSTIIQTATESCINRIEVNRYNPFIEGKESDKRKFTNINSLKMDRDFSKKVVSANLNLVKIFTHMSNFVSMYDKHYSSFILNKALNSLIYSASGQKQNSLHRYYKTDYIFSNEKFSRDYSPRQRLRYRDEKFSYSKVTPTKHNLYNFINYPQYSV